MSDASAPPYVLLIDSDNDAGSMLSDLFTEEGWQCDYFDDTKTGLKAAEKTSYDIVVAEITSDQSGELVKTLKKVSSPHAIIALGDSSAESDVLQILESGVVDYFPKPVNLTDVRDTVFRVIQSRDSSSVREVSESVSDGMWLEIDQTCQELCAKQVHFTLAERLFNAGLITHTEQLRLELAFQEGLVNAIDHGNLELLSEWKEELLDGGMDRYSVTKRERLADPAYGGKRVKVEMSFKKGWLNVRIIDEGNGFSKTADYDPKSSDLYCYGRGIALMRASMDSVEFLSNGTELLMKKKLR